jgi:lipopolysaccharide exporter
VPISKLINLQGELFATAFAFLAQAVIRLGSSLILTRILRPEAYGTITLLMSIIFVVEMLSDIGVTVFIVRDKNGEQPRYLNTAWTIRLVRYSLNSAILFLCAPWIATSFYDAPGLVAPLRVFSPWFLILGLESMSFPLAIRRKQSRILMYSELSASVLSTAFTVVYCLHAGDYWGMVYGTLLNRLLLTLLSHAFFRDFRPKLQFDRRAAGEMLRFTKFTVPSSWLTLALSQFDKMIFLRLFDLHLLGVYGVAANIAGSIEALISKVSQMVLYPRLAHGFRADRDNFPLKYYTGNIKLFATILIVPAAIGGAARLIIAVLYDPRYAQAGTILQAFMVRALLLSLASPAEDLLIAAGEYQVILHGNILRATWTVAASLAGYHFFGFTGFMYGVALSGAPPLIYYLWLQRAKGMMIVRYEFFKVAFALAVAMSAYLTSSLLLTLWQTTRNRI